MESLLFLSLLLLHVLILSGRLINRRLTSARGGIEESGSGWELEKERNLVGLRKGGLEKLGEFQGRVGSVGSVGSVGWVETRAELVSTSGVILLVHLERSTWNWILFGLSFWTFGLSVICSFGHLVNWGDGLGWRMGG